MPESSSQEKTEDATPKRLRDARKKGQVAKSKDLSTVAVMVGGVSALLFMRGYMASKLKILAETELKLITNSEINTNLLFYAIKHNFTTYFMVIVPFLIAVVVIAFSVSFLQVGPIFSAEPMKPQPKRLNLVENLKNMFKMKTVVELLKNVAKISLIFYLAYSVISSSLREVVLTATGTPQQSMQVAGSIVSTFLAKVFIVFIIIAIIDFSFQRYDFKKQMRMTKEEVKREYKEDEGDPLIKSTRRQLHRELATSDVKQQVGVSDAVITNPTSVAVAIKYDDQDMIAPQITAKGQRLYADFIKEIAEEEGIPVIQNVPLAWTLIELDVGEDIPEDLYAAIAEILVYVYKLKGAANELEEV